MPFGRAPAVLAVVALSVGLSPVRAMQVASAPVETLLEEADVAIRGLVLEVAAERVPERPGLIRTRHAIVVWEHLKAPRGDDVNEWASPGIEILEVLQPGGHLGTLQTVVSGVVRLRPGDEVVLLLTRTPWGLQPLGYALGTFFVEADSSLRPAWPGHRNHAHGLTLLIQPNPSGAP